MWPLVMEVMDTKVALSKKELGNKYKSTDTCCFAYFSTPFMLDINYYHHRSNTLIYLKILQSVLDVELIIYGVNNWSKDAPLVTSICGPFFGW